MGLREMTTKINPRSNGRGAGRACARAFYLKISPPLNLPGFLSSNGLVVDRRFVSADERAGAGVPPEAVGRGLSLQIRAGMPGALATQVALTHEAR